MAVDQRNDKSFSTTDLWWDCECESDYIHKKSTELICGTCGCVEANSPDSRVNEVLAEFPDEEV